jgi:hypothetical protein
MLFSYRFDHGTSIQKKIEKALRVKLGTSSIIANRSFVTSIANSTVLDSSYKIKGRGIKIDGICAFPKLLEFLKSKIEARHLGKRLDQVQGSRTNNYGPCLVGQEKKGGPGFHC